jgi:acyl-coenzyme A synthetase/AMP-(fatty) acid ligase
MADYVTSPFNIAEVPADSNALRTPLGFVTYGELRERINLKVQLLEESLDGLLICGFASDPDSIITYLAAIQSGRPIMLIDPASGEKFVNGLIERFRPALLGGILGIDSKDLNEVEAPYSGASKSLIYLPTSGSTGSAKMVRLPVSAISANAKSISKALGITNSQIAPLNLPLFYSYGVSILNSHLVEGACLALPGQNFMEAEFWKRFDMWGCTSLAGVPISYEMLKRLKFNPKDHPSLAYMTQAGGKLPLELQVHFHELMDEAGGRFIVMYGQTEAGARMAVLPHEEFINKKGSVGYAIPGGHFKILNDENLEVSTNTVGQIMYSGPNVMHGYSEIATDDEYGDTSSGTLATGDLGFLDDDDCLWVTGRSKRIAKIFGIRVNLDDVEQMAFSRGYVTAALSGEDRLVLVVEGGEKNPQFVRDIAKELGVHHSGIIAFAIDVIPTLPNGKRDYSGLTKLYC